MGGWGRRRARSRCWGGRRVVRVRDVADGLAETVARVAATGGDTLVVLEGGALTRRGKLVGLVEGMAEGAAVACYPEEGAGLRGMIAGRLEGAGVRADEDALDWLRDHLGGDYASTLGEVEKLVLYAGEGRRLDLDAVRACVGDLGATSMDEAVYAVTLGDMEGLDRAVVRAFAEGLSSVGLLRGMLGHLVRLHQVRGRMAGGMAVEAAVKGLRPPVFWKRERDLVRSAGGWPEARITAALGEVRRAELACKQTGAPDEVIARRLLLALCSGGRR